jgi:DNA repair protein RadA/Sms
MREDGIAGLADPSGLFLSERGAAVAGTCVTVCIEGKRPLVTEVQALVARTTGGGSPRRSVTDLDSGRVAMLLAVLARHGGLPLGEFEVYAATVGGLQATEPAADLAVALALASAARDSPMPQTLCAIGEVSLSGDVRRVSGLDRRLAEAARLGFRLAFVPAGQAGVAPGIQTLPVGTLVETLARMASLADRIGDPRRPVLRTIAGGGEDPWARTAAARVGAPRT